MPGQLAGRPRPDLLDFLTHNKNSGNSLEIRIFYVEGYDIFVRFCGLYETKGVG